MVKRTEMNVEALRAILDFAEEMDATSVGIGNREITFNFQISDGGEQEDPSFEDYGSLPENTLPRPLNDIQEVTEARDTIGNLLGGGKVDTPQSTEQGDSEGSDSYDTTRYNPNTVIIAENENINNSPYTSEEAINVVKDYIVDVPMRVIMERYGGSSNYIYKLTNAIGIDTKRKVSGIVRLTSQGKKKEDIAERLSISPVLVEYVQQTLVERGVSTEDYLESDRRAHPVASD